MFGNQRRQRCDALGKGGEVEAERSSDIEEIEGISHRSHHSAFRDNYAELVLPDYPEEATIDSQPGSTVVVDIPKPPELVHESVDP